MKVLTKRIGITGILRRIWLFSANKIKSFEFVSKQPTQLIIAAEIRHIHPYFGSNETLIVRPTHSEKWCIFPSWFLCSIELGFFL